MEHLLVQITKNTILEPGTIIRCIGNEKDQQACFVEYNEDKSLILINIIDVSSNSLFACNGILKPTKEDKLFYYDSSFRDSHFAEKALQIARNWTLFQQHVHLQPHIINFIITAYVPEQILELEKIDGLSLMFIPIQQKFRIGRFAERRSPERVCQDAFRLWLDSLRDGEHITFIAQVMHQRSHTPKFYSAGTKPHEATTDLLEKEPFNFKPTHGGHIQASGSKNGKRHFIVDAGLIIHGKEVKSAAHNSKQIVGGLKKVFPVMEFTGLEGCEALEKEQRN